MTDQELLRRLKAGESVRTEAQWVLGMHGTCVIAHESPEVPTLIADCDVHVGTPAHQPQLEIRQANAKFIVRAWNCFDDLLNACKKAKEMSLGMSGKTCFIFGEILDDIIEKAGE